MMRHVSRRPMNRRRAANEPVRRCMGLPPELFSRIVQAVPMQAAAERYGLSPNSHGWCCCPFHSEKTPSFKIYPGTGGFYCFGCGAGGDVVSFAEKLFGFLRQRPPGVWMPTSASACLKLRRRMLPRTGRSAGPSGWLPKPPPNRLAGL